MRELAPLGAGAFGRVSLVAHGGRRFALKRLSKAALAGAGLVEHVKRERAALAECDSPFIVRLEGSYQAGRGGGGGQAAVPFGWMFVPV